MFNLNTFSIFLLLFSNEAVSEKNENSPRIFLDSTIFVGREMITWKGNTFSAFRGIQFAESPLRVNRFRDPKPILQYEPGIYDATEDKNDCPSPYATNPSEDCLFLNVYTRTVFLTNSSTLRLRPVLAFIHPGGFYVGSGLSTFIGPDYILEEDIVLVIFNYRLASLGFLNLGTEDIPGNAGLKDQVLALRWIKKHISKFGGDPNSITLMGYSAGAFSVCLHLVSPMSKGLFHRAIIMSGSIPPQTYLPVNQFHLAARQATVLGCTKETTSSQEILQCLNSFNGTTIASTLRRMFEFGKDNPIFLWLPVIEENFGQERFLIEDPYKALQRGDFNRVPILAGFTKNELCTSAVDILTNSTLLKEFNENLNRLGPICFMYSPTSSNESTNLIRRHYFLEGDLNETHLDQLCSLFSDSVIRFGSHRLAQITSRFVDVFTYKFSYLGRYSNLYYPNFGDVFGPEHMDDLMYIFKNGPATFTPSDRESIVVELMTKLVVSFAKDGKPLHQQQSDVIWRFSENTYAEITDKFEIKTGRNFEQEIFWDTLFSSLK